MKRVGRYKSLIELNLTKSSQKYSATDVALLHPCGIGHRLTKQKQFSRASFEQANKMVSNLAPSHHRQVSPESLSNPGQAIS